MKTQIPVEGREFTLPAKCSVLLSIAYSARTAREVVTHSVRLRRALEGAGYCATREEILVTVNGRKMRVIHRDGVEILDAVPEEAPDAS
jgi:hypothetical protein